MRFHSPPWPSHPPCVVDLLDEGVVLLPEGHGGGGGVGLSAWPALALPLLGTWAEAQDLR